MSNPEIVILVVATMAIALFSWKFSIKAKRFHGIYRFFSFEAIVVLVLLNWSFWFADPFSWNQIISWFLLVGSIPVAEEGFRLLRVVGKPEGQFENTTKLVTVGIYRYIRHPLYGSLVLLGFGVFFKQLSVPGVVLALVNLAALIATAKTEEKEMLDAFGDEYLRYVQQSKMFIPYVL